MNDSKRVLTSKEYDFFFTELDRLKGSNVFSQDTLDAIRARYERGEESSTARKTMFISLIVFGAIAFTFCVYTFLGEYWDDLSEGMRMTLSLVPFVGTYIAYFITRRLKLVLTSRILLLAGCGFFLLAAAFMISEYEPANLELDFAWLIAGLTTFAAGYFSDRKGPFILAAVFLTIWTLFSHSSLSSLDAFPAQCETFFIPVVVALGLYWSYRRVEPIVGACYILVFLQWALQLTELWNASRFGAIHVTFAGSAAALLAYYCRSIGVFKRGVEYIPYAVTLIALAILTSTLEYPRLGYNFNELLHEDKALPGLCVLVASIVTLALIAVRKRGAWNLRQAVVALVSPEGLGLAILPIYCLKACVESPSEELHWGFSVYANILMACAGLRFMFLGVKRSKFEFRLGAGYFMLWLLLRLLNLATFFKGDDEKLACLFFGGLAIALFIGAFFFAKFAKRFAITNLVDEENATIEREPKPAVSESVGALGLYATVALQAFVVGIAPFC